MKKLWLFDLDGTLADTDRDIREAWKATLRDLDLECPSFDRDFVAGPPIEDMARTLFPHIYTDELGALIRAGFGAHYDHDGFANTYEYPGVMERVREFKAAGDKVVIATNKRYAGAMLMAKKFGWPEVFDGIFAGDMYKDDPAIGKMAKGALVGLIMSRFAAPPEACTLVGDTKSDFNAARENGIESVGVTWGYGTPEELALADRLASTAAEI